MPTGRVRAVRRRELVCGEGLRCEASVKAQQLHNLQHKSAAGLKLASGA